MAGVVVLHVSDVHCASDKLRGALESLSYDAVAATGDFECLQAVEVLLTNARAPVAAVTGNVDHAAIYRRLREAGVAVDGSYSSLAGLSVAGVGGLDPGTSMRRLLAGPPRGVDLLLSHHPPLGVLDRSLLGVNAGLEALWRVLEALEPRAHLFGHIHEARGWEARGGRVYVNPGPLAQGYYAVLHVSEAVRVELGRL